MFRLAFFPVIAACLFNVSVRAEDPSTLVIAVPNHQTVSLLPPLPRGTVVSVLIHERSDDYATINARAMAMRHATHFVSDCDDSSLLSQMFQERLTNLGAVPIKVRRSRSRVIGLACTREEILSNRSLANLFAGP